MSFRPDIIYGIQHLGISQKIKYPKMQGGLRFAPPTLHVRKSGDFIRLKFP
ncbi:Uncharacterized protein dnm_056700 [Desulfonema magnum]|uniref:Uncharacterized protein n=1 Tax=Desulfonema magnum TaxID=45655 RepID=A0A975BPR8_9BACT|nr:Uncharacterized protein dnm_056700 [Desulfonema magnum]